MGCRPETSRPSKVHIVPQGSGLQGRWVTRGMQLRFGEVSPHHSVVTSGPCTVDLICQGGCYAVVAMAAREDFAASLLCCTLGKLLSLAPYCWCSSLHIPTTAAGH